MILSKLSILIPLYNEEEFIGTILPRVIEAPLPKGMDREIIVVDDGSDDESARLVQEFVDMYPNVIRLIRHDRNQGKGAAIRTAIEHATGEFSIIQDADLEYNPREYRRILRPLVAGAADAVFGSRFMIAGERRVLYFWHAVANRVLTTLCNMLADVNLTDMETCYKAFRTELVQSIPIRSERFGIEPELTIKLAQRKARIFETPISYHGRTYAEGKKIGLKDAFDALFVMLATAASRDIYKEGARMAHNVLSTTPRFNRWLAETVQPYLGKEILELGAGNGDLTRLFVRRTRRYVATDVDKFCVSQLSAQFEHRQNFETRYCDLNRAEDFSEFAGQLDTVVCHTVLERMENDKAGLRHIASALKPGGRAIIVVPCATRGKASGHRRHYSTKELQEKIAQAGLSVDRMLAFNKVSRPDVGEGLVNRGRLRLFDSSVWLWRRLDNLLPFKPASIIAIASKPAREQGAGTGGGAARQEQPRFADSARRRVVIE